MLRWRRPKGVQARWRTIPCGKRGLRLLIVSPENAGGEPRPGVLWLHGGGYFLGMPEMVYMSRAIDLVTRCGAVVLSPAYTLGPWPIALQECHSALVWMRHQARELGIRPEQIMVGGESAGGGLTAALCMLARDRGTVRIAFQMPLYPMLDHRDTETSRDCHAPVWNTRRNHFAWKRYLRGVQGEISPYASPALQTDWRNLPPCYSFVGDLDPFLQETLDYGAHLREAGVEARVDVYPGFWHAYDMMHPEKAQAAAETFVERFRDACERFTAPQG